jgi:hypothetical protein
MKIQPRQQLLDIWRAVARASIEDGKWLWGGRRQTNCISDAEQLLCLMYPASEVPAFKLDLPDETAEDVLDALAGVGDALEIPQMLVNVLGEYLATYTTEAGAPSFGGGTYFFSADPDREPTPDQAGLQVVDGYSMSVTLMLAAIGFVRVFRSAVRREELRGALDELEAAASKRLSAAMVGLLRSFTVKVFQPDSRPGRTLIHSVNQDGLPDRVVAEQLQGELAEIRAGIRDLSIGSGQPSELDNPNRLFECGWSWGVVKDAPEIVTSEDVGPQPLGVAHTDPYLYFTVVALDGIADLFSERTAVLGLLNEEQIRLAQALRLRWELTQRYWATIGGAGRERWSLEDLPWRTTDGKESDYFSLLVTSMVVQNLVSRRATDAELRRVARLLEELAERGRVTRRALDVDPALELHDPGVALDLRGSDDAGGPLLQWVPQDYSAVLLKRALALTRVARSTELRDPLLGLVDEVWSHVLRRRIQGGQGRDLWDDPGNVYLDVQKADDLPSWYYTERIVECLVEATNLLDSAPLRSGRLIESALDLLNEAEHLFDAELLRGTTQAGRALRDSLQQMQADLVRAREIISDRPGTALVLASEVLRDLDRLTVARRDASGAI